MCKLKDSVRSGTDICQILKLQRRRRRFRQAYFDILDVMLFRVREIYKQSCLNKLYLHAHSTFKDLRKTARARVSDSPVVLATLTLICRDSSRQAV